ncbi:hypothetical protein [Neptuniibacter marinus]|uniref:hypothetical protein n=1 Tax=Neptuniibacter marinus TaxID=1806670 RepID=UPI000A685651|nr:hypothetical protein [Neptuniibacter marinus]
MNNELNKSLSDIGKRHEFEAVDELYISKLSNKDLAAWQSQFSPNNPQYIVASHEWQRRLVVEQVKTSRVTALMGVLGTLLGVIVGHIITKYW